MKLITIEVHTCMDCPHADDVDRCELIDNSDCTISNSGIRSDCPLPDSE